MFRRKFNSTPMLGPRTILLSLVFTACLVWMCRFYGQMSAANSDKIVLTKRITSRIGQPQAIAVASKLTKGMREEDAETVLELNGFGSSICIGDSFCWDRFFDLTNGICLGLEIKPKKFRPDGAWMDGLVEAAFIQSNGINIVYIAFTNAP